VPRDAEVILDGSRTFDSFNLGFDSGDTNVFEKDTLTFTWEWLAGPVRVDPTPTDPTDPSEPTATVVLPAVGAYEYRLIVDDNVNALPSSDTVLITVVESLPAMNPPRAVIAGPASAVEVGEIITLYGDEDPDGNTLSYDPDGDELHYRWVQTNELGGPLDPDELQEAFQPLSDVDQPRSTWQAIAPGTFYFRLLVDDGDFRSSTTFSVEVVEAGAGTGGTTQQGDSGTTGDGGASGDDSGSTTDDTPAAPTCGVGLAPLALLPFALCALRRRVR
jgi:hypothetical protein